MVEVPMAQSGPAQAPAPPAPAQAPEAPAVGVGTEQPAPGRITIQKDGKTITLDGATGAGGDVATVGFPGGPPDIPSNVYMLAKDGIVGFTLMVIAFPVFGFLKALVVRRANTQAALPARDTTDRLQRIEAAVEAMSVEVERISEGQRFVTRVLSERSSAQP
ncbi:MAG: hypothetical protein IT355_12245 [Gemmatimonadaceae bacterium]|nr:hypothetical protein [Gemmatimonadaceae bacterium]